MNAYIDLSNFCSYLSSMSNQDFSKCNEVLLGNFNLYFTFGKDELSRTKKEIQKNFQLWLKTATKNRNGNHNEWGAQFPPRPIKKDLHDRFSKEQLSSIYFLDGDHIKEWADLGCLLIAIKGEELKVLNNLRIANAFNPTKQFRIRDLVDWSVFGDNCSPCTDILFVDRYAFAQSDHEYIINSYALIEQLCKWAKNTTVNIVFFTLKDYKDEAQQRHDIPAPTIIRNLKTKLKDSIGVEPNITFVFIPDKDQHDRTIFTNYKLFTSGDSYKYFKDGANVSLCTYGEWMYINSLFDSDNMKNAEAFVSDLQKLVDKVKPGLMSIVGDKKCRFLKL